VTAALALLVAACTIEDASDKRAADSAAAKSEVQTSASGGTVAPAQPAPVASDTSPAAVPGDPATPAAGAAGAAPTTGPSAATGAPADSGAANPTRAARAAGNLSPDSVDVERTTRATLLPVASTRIEVDLNAKQLRVFDGANQVGSYA
jgi:hypothetical protein